MAMALPAPSAPSGSCRARSAQPCVSSAANFSGSGLTPAAPLASSSTVSLVDMHPSVSSRSNVVATAPRSAASSPAAPSSASVVSTASIVASAGASMAAPLAMPPISYPGPGTRHIFDTVSVVLIASAAADPPPVHAVAAPASTAGTTRSLGSRPPIRPAHHTPPSPPPPAGAPGGPAFPRRSFLAPQSRRRRAPLARGSWRDPAGGEAGRLRQAEHEVGVLDGLAGGALSEVVDGRHRGSPAGPGVGCGLQVHAVRPRDRGRGRPAPVREHADERLAGVGLGESRAQLGACPASRSQPCRAGREYPPWHGRQQRGERDRRVLLCCLAERLLDLRSVPVRPGCLVGRDRAHHLAAEQIRPGGASGA